MEIKGKIKRILEEKKVSDKFTIREFDIETTGEQYPQVIRCQLSNDKINKILNFKPGDEVIAMINIRGREWKKSETEIVVFNTLDVWQIKLVADGSPAPIQVEETQGSDDLPF